MKNEQKVEQLLKEINGLPLMEQKERLCAYLFNSSYYLYIMIETNDRYYKIGVTDDPEKRLKQLNAVPRVGFDFLRVYRLEDSPAKVTRVENTIHDLLTLAGLKLNEKKEYFNLTEHHLSLVDTIMQNLFDAEVVPEFDNNKVYENIYTLNYNEPLLKESA